MKVSIRDIQKQSIALDIQGDEPWLAEQYAAFPVPEDRRPPTMSGRLSMRWEVPEMGLGHVRVEGQLSYAPFVSCSRCDDPIPWPLRIEICATFRSDAQRQDDVDESSVDDSTFYEWSHGVLDLGPVINDSIWTALPIRQVLEDESQSCRVCGIDLSQTLVYGDDSPTEARSQGGAAEDRA